MRARVRPSAWAVCASLFLAGASDPEIIRVRAPANDLARWVPPGTEVRVMPPAQFESLARATQQNARLAQLDQAPRLIRARHAARFGKGVLSGRSEFVFERSQTGPMDFVLKPWTPAVLPTSEAKKLLGARATGEPSLWVDAVPKATYVLEWELRPRPYAYGQGMVLRLPGNETTVLSLELPREWAPSARRGIRRGPLPVLDSDANRWEVEAESGQIDLQLYEPAHQGAGAVEQKPWLTSTTEIDLQGSRSRGGQPVNWTTAWSVQLDPRNPRPLEIELDPGLELIEVQGPAVRGYHTTRSGQRTRLHVALEPDLNTPALLRFLAHVFLPAEGSWTIPAMRPLDACWTEGRTTIVLDAFHILEDCREKAGRRVLPSPNEPGRADRLVFETPSPESVAELVFRAPRAEARCEVRGQLFVGSAPGRLECELKWVFARTPLSELAIDLAPAWICDRVWIRGRDDPLIWQSSPLPDGKTRVQVALPAAALAQKELTLVVGAKSTLEGGPGPLDLPRVRPSGVPLAEEAWLAWVDPDTMIRPISATGLAWIDSAAVDGLVSSTRPGPELREALAWRWTRLQAAARVERERIELGPRATIHTKARIDQVHGRLLLEGHLVLSSPDPASGSMPVWIEQTGADLGTWHFRDEALGKELSLRALDAAERARLDFPKDGFAGCLLFKVPGKADKTISYQAELAWNAAGSIPLLAVPRRSLVQGVIELETPRFAHCRLQTTGLRRLDPAALAGLDTEGDLEFDDGSPGEPLAARDAIVHAFAYGEAGARLGLRTELLTLSAMSGVIREAILTTRIDPGGRLLNRLRLLISPGIARQFELVMPDGLSLVRVRRDGLDLAPLRSNAGLSIPLRGPSHGSRSSAVVVDYEAAMLDMPAGARLLPALPAVGMPCLSFVWELLTPPGWAAVDPGSQWVAHDRAVHAHWPFGALWRYRPWSALSSNDAPRVDPKLLAALNDRLPGPTRDELTFAEWFSRWDAGAVPVVVDRVCLDSAGVAPRSQCVLSHAASERGNISLTILKRHGLALVPAAGAVVITTDVEARRLARDDRRAQAVAEALAWGSDASDRFQTVARWRGEASPRRFSPGRDEPAEGIKLLPGWSRWSFSGSSWPAGDAHVYLVDASARALTGWIIIGLCLITASMCRKLSARWKVLILSFVLLASIGLDWVLPSRYSGLAAAGFVGALVLLVVELAQAARPSFANGSSVRRLSESSLLRGLARSAALGMVLTLAGAQLVPALPAVQPDGARPILALFPYEGSFDPARPADRVLLRLADFERLTQLARSGASTPRSSVRAISLLHRVLRRNAGNIVVESELELVAVGDGPFSWEMPVSGARDIVATLNGKEQVVSIKPGGERANIALPGAGSFLLRVRRTASAKVEGGLETLNLGVNAMPSARVIIARSAEHTSACELEALGGTRVEPDGTVVAFLGPADRVLARWPGPNSAAQPRAAGSIQGLILWDIDPAGDHLRARFRCPQTRSLSEIRFDHEPGLLLRSASLPEPAVGFWEENPAHDQWILHADPPIPPDGSIALDCWMPLRSPLTSDEASAATGARSVMAPRRIPRLKPSGQARYSGSLGVRRPGTWTGRLSAFPVPDLLGDEAFVRAWGNLPDEPLTLCGTSRFVGECSAALRTGPAASSTQVKPNVELQIESGRILMTAEAQVTELAGHLQKLALALPGNIQNVQVSADGLMDWTISSDSELQLLFDPAAGQGRRLRISGWIPTSDDPLDIRARRHHVPTPWIHGKDVVSAPGFLTISSTSRPELTGAAGATPISSESSTSGEAAPPRYRQTFRVDDPRSLGEIFWERIPPRVSVAIESQMTIFPDTAEWVAVLRYDALGGALDSIHLRMPANWAARAEIALAGGEYQLTKETRGTAAVWTITPERPIWGSQRFVLRSTLALASEREIVHPEITPLGEGAVDAYLRIVNATGQSLAIANHPGLQPVLTESRFKAQEFARGMGSVVAAFRVERNSWSLRAQLAFSPSEGNHQEDETARVASCDLIVAVRSDGSSLGRVVYQTVPGSGRALRFVLPEGGSLLWAMVDSNPVIPLHSSSGSGSILLFDHRPSRVTLIWGTAPARAGLPGAPKVLELPRAGAGLAPALVAVHAPLDVSIQEHPAGLEQATMAALELARADTSGRSISDFLPQIDRSSGRDHEKLVSLLIDYDLALRSAIRSSAWDGGEGAGLRSEHTERDLALFGSARQDRIETVRSAGFNDDLASAQTYLGQASGSPGRPVVAVGEPGATERVRLFGRPSAWIGLLPGSSGPSSASQFRTVSRPWEGIWRQAQDRESVLLLLFPALTFFPLAWPGRRWSASLALAATVGLAAFLGGPITLAAGLGVVAAGWMRGPRGA
jgi:hypothetical protein